jgi:hypothetical protein
MNSDTDMTQSRLLIDLFLERLLKNERKINHHIFQDDKKQVLMKYFFETIL